MGNRLIEKTKFIAIYSILKTIKGTIISLGALSADSGFKVYDLKCAIAYYDSRGVFLFENYHVIADNAVLNAVIHAVQSGESFNSIRQWNSWKSYYEFLFYRYHQNVLRAKIRERRIEPTCNREKLSEHIEPVLQDMLCADEDITIGKVCKKVGICNRTLRLWGGFQLVAAMKEEQSRIRADKIKADIHAAFRTCLDSHYGARVSGREVYSSLGITRQVLKRIAPEMTAYISIQIKEYNQLFNY